MAEKPISAHEAATEVPLLRECAGNRELLDDLNSRLTSEIGSEANTLIMGEPGTGKTNMALAYFRERFRNPLFNNGDVNPAINPEATRKCAEDIRIWQTCIEGKILHYLRVDGATASRSRIESAMDSVFGVCTRDHTFVLLDEAGELFARELDMIFRPILTDPQITVIATAQGFPIRGSSLVRQLAKNRLKAFLRRFPLQYQTTLLKESEMITFLVKKMQKWQLKLDEPETLRVLALKSTGIVSYGLNSLIKAINAPDRRLTRHQVEHDQVDPLANNMVSVY